MKPISMINMALSRDSEELKRETKIELYQIGILGVSVEEDESDGSKKKRPFQVKMMIASMG